MDSGSDARLTASLAAICIRNASSKLSTRPVRSGSRETVRRGPGLDRRRDRASAVAAPRKVPGRFRFRMGTPRAKGGALEFAGEKSGSPVAGALCCPWNSGAQRNPADCDSRAQSVGQPGTALGYPARMNPVFIWYMARPCAGDSAWQERINARSSTCRVICGIRSQTQVPLSPYWRKAKGDFINGPGLPKKKTSTGSAGFAGRRCASTPASDRRYPRRSGHPP